MRPGNTGGMPAIAAAELPGRTGCQFGGQGQACRRFFSECPSTRRRLRDSKRNGKAPAWQFKAPMPKRKWFGVKPWKVRRGSREVRCRGSNPRRWNFEVWLDTPAGSAWQPKGSAGHPKASNDHLRGGHSSLATVCFTGIKPVLRCWPGFWSWDCPETAPPSRRRRFGRWARRVWRPAGRSGKRQGRPSRVRWKRSSRCLPRRG